MSLNVFMAIEGWPLSLLYNVARDAWSYVSGRGRKRTEKSLQSREKWKNALQEYLLDIWSKELRDDVIIRDFRRLREYPKSDRSSGISPWFKVGILELYDNGVKVGLRISRLVFEESENAWRKVSSDEGGAALKAYLVGYIPYENIEFVDFSGDEYYSFPHIVCHFRHSRQPYERLAYCEQKTLDGRRHFYTELEDFDVVRLTSAKFGTDKEW